MKSTASKDQNSFRVAKKPRSGKPLSPNVQGNVVEDHIAEKRIGERIKNLRQKKLMGLVELGRHTGLSASFLSQLETGRVVPTLRNLTRIGLVFSKDLSYFFDPEPQTLFRIHRRGDRMRLPQIGSGEPAYFFESLAYQVVDRQMDPYLAEFQPMKSGTVPRAHRHPGCEFLYLISGKLEMQHGSEAYTIEAGDAVYFDADTTHSYRCASDTPTTAILVTLQQSRAPAMQRSTQQRTVPGLPSAGKRTPSTTGSEDDEDFT